MKVFDYNWDNYQDDFMSVVYAIEKSGIKYDLVVGIANGGLVPGVHVANAINSSFAVLQWSNTVGRVRDISNPHIRAALDKGQKILVVDDICDSGITLDDVTSVYKGVDTAVLIYNNINKRNFAPTYYGWEINRNDIPYWFEFWWERK